MMNFVGANTLPSISTHDQDVNPEELGQALPDQLVPDVALLEQPLHHRGVWRTFWSLEAHIRGVEAFYVWG